MLAKPGQTLIVDFVHQHVQTCLLVKPPFSRHFRWKTSMFHRKKHFAHGTYVLTKEQLKTRNRPGEALVEGLLEATKT